MCANGAHVVSITAGVQWIECDGRHGDYGRFGKALFQIVELSLTFGEAGAPAVIMDCDSDLIRIVEGSRTQTAFSRKSVQ